MSNLLSEATEQDILSRAKMILTDRLGLAWDDATDEQRNDARIEATFTYSWFC